MEQRVRVHRARLGNEEFRVVRPLLTRTSRTRPAIDHRRREYRSFRDHLAFDLAARTLFVVGSPTAFREYGTAPRGLVDQAPSYPQQYPDAGHFCVELSPGPWSRFRNRPRVPGRLHIQHSGDWLV